MVYYNISGSISRVSIGENNDIVFFPLVPNIKEYESSKEHLVGVQSTVPREGTYAYFIPLCLPIRGKYDECGGLKDIIENENTKALEKFFGISIQEFVNIVTHPKGIASETFQPLLDGLIPFFDQTLVEIWKYDYKDINEKSLLTLGFVPYQEGEDDGIMRYCVYHNGLPSIVTLLSNETGQKIGFSVYREGKTITHEETFFCTNLNFIYGYFKATGHCLGVSEENQKKVKLLLSISGMFEHYSFYQNLCNHRFSEGYMITGDHIYSYFQLAWPYFGQIYLSEVTASDPILERLRHLHPQNILSEKDYISWIKNHSLKDDFFNYIQFRRNCYEGNIFFFPSECGPQYGNLCASLTIAQEVIKLVEKQIKY